MLPKKLLGKLEQRTRDNALRTLPVANELVDFSSNDYLGFSKSQHIFKRTAEILKEQDVAVNGATGSRLLTGNHRLFEVAEKQLAEFHQVESALVYNSGYDANIGFFSAVPQRGDLIFYDEHCHASIRDGIQMGYAKAFKFKHNNLSDLKAKSKVKDKPTNCDVYVVTESIFSMDGGSPDLSALIDFCTTNNYHLVIDEAHALGVMGRQGEGLVQQLGLQQKVFARLVTFGKALGCHGAAVLGSKVLIDYLINFSRSFMYTTALPPHSVATIIAGYEQLCATNRERQQLEHIIASFTAEIEKLGLQEQFRPSLGAIQSCVIPGNDRLKEISNQLQIAGYDVKPILSPTVPQGEERLRICLHCDTSPTDISALLKTLKHLLHHA